MKLKYSLSVFVFFAYVLISLHFLSTGHPHEDVYILYIFSESFAYDNTISYYPNGARAEGATDFLWMILLGLFVKAGFDVAISASVLNGIGLAVICLVSLSFVSTKNNGKWSFAFSFLIAILVLISPISAASLAGFSTGFYCSLIAILFYLMVNESKRYLNLLPVIGVTIGLLRPDGVIIGATASAIGIIYAYRNGTLRSYLYISSICFTVGTAYFIWRYNYFGYLLPLPLYVKSASFSSFPGLSPNIHWVINNVFIGLLSFSAIILLRDRWKIIIASIPVIVLFVALLFATQSQNVSFRFQAPGTTLLILITSIFVLNRQLSLAKIKTSALDSFIFLLLIFSAIFYGSQLNTIGAELTNKNYINYFPYHLSPYTNDDTSIALTEAGRLAYWMKGKKYDLVGLNTPYSAIEKTNPEYIDHLDPDLIFIHTADTIDLSNYCSHDYCKIDSESLKKSRTSNEDWKDIENGVRRAPIAAYDFLSKRHNEYIIYIVRYYGAYSHLYALKINGDISSTDFERSLKKSFDYSLSLSYLEMRDRTVSIFQD